MGLASHFTFTNLFVFNLFSFSIVTNLLLKLSLLFFTGKKSGKATYNSY